MQKVGRKPELVAMKLGGRLHVRHKQTGSAPSALQAQEPSWIEEHRSAACISSAQLARADK